MRYLPVLMMAPATPRCGMGGFTRQAIDASREELCAEALKKLGVDDGAAFRSIFRSWSFFALSERHGRRAETQTRWPHSPEGGECGH